MDIILQQKKVSTVLYFINIFFLTFKTDNVDMDFFLCSLYLIWSEKFENLYFCILVLFLAMMKWQHNIYYCIFFRGYILHAPFLFPNDT